MKGMTIKQIAEACNVAESTVRSWAHKTAESADISAKIAKSRGKRAVKLSLDETLAIVRAGGRHTLASLLEENAKKHSGDDRIHRFPNGAQLTELRRIYGPQEAARRVDFAIGYSRGEAVASPEEAREGFEMVKGILKQKQLDFNN